MVTSAATTSGRIEWQVIGATGQIMKKGVISSARTEINISPLPGGQLLVTNKHK